MASSANVPASIPKSVLPTLARARELTSRDPVIAYWCKLKATQTLFDASPSDTQGREYLLSLIEDLEATKARLADNELIKDDLAGSAYVYNFASRVFDGADATDRAGKASMITAKEFLAASVFYDVLTVFGPLETDVADKNKYAKWKASSIAKAIKEGRSPEPGPADGLGAAAAEEPSSEAMAAAAAAAAASTQDIPDQAIVNGGNESSEEAEDVRRQLLPDTPGTAPRVDDGSGDEGEGDDALPTALKDMPPRTRTDEEKDGLLPSVPGDFGSASPLPQHSLPAPPSPPPAAVQQAPPPPITFSLPPPSAAAPAPGPSAPPRSPSSNVPPTSAPSAPSAPPAAVNGSSSGGDDEDWRPEPATVDPTTIASCQKHAKWAISALNYEDLETARKELRLALQLIGG